MTNFNSGFNNNFNPALNPKFNPKLNPNINTVNKQLQGPNNNNPYINAVNQSVIKPVVNNNEQNPKNVLKQISEEQASIAETVNETLVQTNASAKMNSDALLKYLKSVMKMPENINKLLSSLDSPIIKALVEKNIDVKILAEILNKNASDAVEKVLKAISESLKAGVKDVNQLKDILGILNTIQNSTSTNVIKELLLLYIPVNPPIYDKNVEFKSQNSEEDDAIKNSDFSLIFETVNFSNILCCINSYDNSIYVRIFVDKIFPLEKFKKIIDTFKKEMNLRIETEENIVKRPEEDKKTARNFSVVSSGFVPCDVLITAHLIVKTIFKIDETFGS